MRLNEYFRLWGRYILKQRNSLYFFCNTNPIIFVMSISLFFDLLYQRGYQMQDLLDIKWRSAGAWVSNGQKQESLFFPHSKHWSKYICCISFLIFSLLYQISYQRQYFWAINWEVLAYEAAMYWNRSIPVQNLKIYNQIVFVLSPDSLSYLMYQNGYQR